MSKVLKWLEDEADRLLEECDSNHDPYKSINNSFLEGFNYALANVQGLEQPQLNENQQIVIDLEMSDCSVEVAGWNYPEELDTENLRYLFSNVLENARALEQEEE